MAPTPQPQPSYGIRVVGARARTPYWRDIYHWLVRVSWPRTMLAILVLLLAANLVFAMVYLVVGGVAHAREGSFADAFFFSVQTMGTIGYGDMHPSTNGSNAIMVVESFVSVVLTALITGLVFAKFSQPTGRISCAINAVVTPFDGQPTLMLRIGNERENRVVESRVHVDLVQTKQTVEGTTFYKMTELPLVRQRIPALSRSWNVMHVIDEKSPLFGSTPAVLEAAETELFVSITGTDETTGQPVYGQHNYETANIVWGAKFANILNEDEHGNLVLDLTRFDEISPSEKTDVFPYSWIPTAKKEPSLS